MTTENIPLSSCVQGHIYILNSRNLHFGAFNGVDGFVGIRTKWGHRYLDTEYHWDQGPPWGTAMSIRDTGDVVPEGVEVSSSLEGTLDEMTNRLIYFDRELLPNVWRYQDTNEILENPRPIAIHNNALFEFLLGLESTFEELKEQDDDR